MNILSWFASKTIGIGVINKLSYISRRPHIVIIVVN
jgi:hypothetical protein